jgi:hypothetical protein
MLPETGDQLVWLNLKCLADPKQCEHGKWPPGFDHLPVAHAETIRINILLAAEQLLRRAVSKYRQAIAIDPSFADALNNLANALADLARVEYLRKDDGMLVATCAPRYLAIWIAKEKVQV